jgi:PIN domain nuclease of toxin-antitoxin system
LRLLLDTHTLLWWLADEELLPQTRAAIADPANVVAVSAASAWEISIKKALGKLVAPNDLEEQILVSGFAPLPIEISHAMRAGQLPHHHEDPFDRMLIAQAQQEQMMVVSRDKRFSDYDVTVVAA